MLDARALRRFDWLLFLNVLTLTVIGIAFIWSATHLIPAFGGLPRQQADWLGVSLIAFLIIILFDYSALGRLAYPAYAVCLLALVLVLVMGVSRNYAQRWFSIFGHDVQPSEPAKIATVLALARYLMYRKNYRTLRGLVLPFLIALVPMGLILKEPDLGTSLLFIPTLFAMLFVAGASVKHLAAVAVAGLAATPVLWFTVMGEYQKARITGWLWPQSDPMGTGWHLRQSIAAVASGGATGNGFAYGSPVVLNRGFAPHTDFIFSVISNEWGFLGAAGVLLLLVLLFSRGYEIAAATREPFGRLLVVGMITMLAFQAFVNIGMTMRLCPITGLTLPFISYGGSSLLTCFIMMGFVVNVGMRRKTVVAPDDF